MKLMSNEQDNKFNRRIAREAGISTRDVKKLKKANRIKENITSNKRISLKSFKRLKEWK